MNCLPVPSALVVGHVVALLPARQRGHLERIAVHERPIVVHRRERLVPGVVVRAAGRPGETLRGRPVVPKELSVVSGLSIGTRPSFPRRCP
jgi:hypothetical protein